MLIQRVLHLSVHISVLLELHRTKCVMLGCVCVLAVLVCCSGSLLGMNCHLCEFPSHMGFGVARWLGQRVQVKKSCSESQRLIGTGSVCVPSAQSVCLSVSSIPAPSVTALLKKREADNADGPTKWGCVVP